MLLCPWFRRKLSYGEVLEYVLWLRERGRLAEEGKIERITADPDDDYLVALASSSVAGIIVSGDRHLLDLGEIRGSESSVLILAPHEFLKEL